MVPFVRKISFNCHCHSYNVRDWMYTNKKRKTNKCLVKNAMFLGFSTCIIKILYCL